MARTKQAADACEMAVLAHVCTYDGDDFDDNATLNESDDDGHYARLALV